MAVHAGQRKLGMHHQKIIHDSLYSIYKYTDLAKIWKITNKKLMMQACTISFELIDYELIHVELLRNNCLGLYSMQCM